jgi:hypothetical protein
MAHTPVSLEADEVCTQVINNLKQSGLTWGIQETPFSAYLTIRKRFHKGAKPKLSKESSDPNIEALKLRQDLQALDSAHKDLTSQYNGLVKVNNKQTKDLKDLKEHQSCKNSLEDLKAKNAMLKEKYDGLQDGLHERHILCRDLKGDLYELRKQHEELKKAHENLEGDLIQTQHDYAEEVDHGATLNHQLESANQQLKLKTEIIKSIPKDFGGLEAAKKENGELKNELEELKYVRQQLEFEKDTNHSLKLDIDFLENVVCADLRSRLKIVEARYKTKMENERNKYIDANIDLAKLFNDDENNDNLVNKASEDKEITTRQAKKCAKKERQRKHKLKMQQNIETGKDAHAATDHNFNKNVAHRGVDQNSNGAAASPAHEYKVRESIAHVVGIILSIVLTQVSYKKSAFSVSTMAVHIRCILDILRTLNYDQDRISWQGNFCTEWRNSLGENIIRRPLLDFDKHVAPVTRRSDLEQLVLLKHVTDRELNIIASNVERLLVSTLLCEGDLNGNLTIVWEEPNYSFFSPLDEEYVTINDDSICINYRNLGQLIALWSVESRGMSVVTSSMPEEVEAGDQVLKDMEEKILLKKLDSDPDL